MPFWKKSGEVAEQEPVAQEPDTGRKRRIGIGLVLAVIGVFVVFCVVVMIANYRFPHFFAVEPAKEPIVGLTSTRTLITVTEKMTERWLPNDKFWPTILLDNPQNFQLGLLEAVRYTVRIYRDKITRLRTTDKIDPNIEQAFIFFSNDPYKWILPSAESKYKAGVASLKKYEVRLIQREANFYPRADNLNELLDQYVSLLGGVNTRLSNAPRSKDRVLTQETAGDAYTRGERYMPVKVPWSQLDDNFYFAQGVAYGIREMMLATKYDFKNIFAVKNAEELVDRIIHLLDESQFEPIVVLNGKRGSIFANHSLVLQALLEDARQKMRSLQDMIRE